MNNSQSRTHHRTVYSSNGRRLDPATVIAVALVLLALVVFFIVLMGM